MTTGPRKQPADPAGAPSEHAPSDAYVSRLGDRISSQIEMPPEQHPLPEVALPGGFQGPPPRESSDVHALRPSSEEDDALEPPPPPPMDASDPFAQFEDEIEGEATRIEDGQLLAEQSTAILEDVPVQPFLQVEKGNDQGREFVLQEGENGIGRGIDNDVILADVAVSRRHLIVVREGETLRLRDLGSGNGTQVNGKRVSSVVLSEGDRIEVGETVLVVRLPGGLPLPALDPDGVTDESNIAGTIPPPAPFVTPSDPFAMPSAPGYSPELTPASTSTPHAPKAEKRGAVVLPKPVFLAILGAAGLFLALLGIAVIVLIVNLTSGGDEPQPVTIASASGPFSRGVAAYEARRWDEAEGAFREALEQSGSDPRANEYLQRTQQAREHEGHVAQARAALARGDSNTALTQASSVPEDSPLAADARAVRAQAQAAQVAGHVAAARAAIAAGNREEAERQLTLARNLDPSSAEVRAVQAELQPVAQAEEPEPEEEPAAVEEEDEAPARRGTAPRRAERRGGSARASVAGAIEHYLAGRFAEAARTARAAASGASGRQRRELTQLASNIERFGTLYGRIQAARFGPSVRSEMEQAIALDRRIARSGQYRDRLRSRVVESYLADAQRQRSNPVQSCSAVRQALAVDSGNVRARQMSAGCETQARGMMREAAGAPPDRARSIYRSVLLMVPGSSAVGREASGRLESLRRTRAVDEDE